MLMSQFRDIPEQGLVWGFEQGVAVQGRKHRDSIAWENGTIEKLPEEQYDRYRALAYLFRGRIPPDLVAQNHAHRYQLEALRAVARDSAKAKAKHCDGCAICRASDCPGAPEELCVTGRALQTQLKRDAEALGEFITANSRGLPWIGDGMVRAAKKV